MVKPVLSARLGLVRVGMDLTELPVVDAAIALIGALMLVGSVALAFVGFA